MEAASDSDYVNDVEDSSAEVNAPVNSKSTLTPPAGEAISEDFESIFRGRKLKRRHPNDDDSSARKRKIIPPYSDSYRKLFNQVVEDVLSPHGEDGLSPSQFGIIEWAAGEKAVLFDYVEKHGQGDLSAIAAAIGTKSPPEVNDYLLLLRQGYRERDLRESGGSLRYGDIPAADQLSASCCAALDRAAESLAFHQLGHEEQLEQSKYGDYWLLTENLASNLNDAAPRKQMSHENGSIPDNHRSSLPSDLRAPVELLNLPKLLELSTRLFMNTGPLQPFENWTTLANTGETPSILATAFVDLHTLALSVTKRLISTTLFLANSRLRANDMKGRASRKAQVKRRDVRAALKILNMKQDLDEYWGGVARRLGLEVYDLDSQQGRGSRIAKMKLEGQEPMTYDEVEERMRERSRSPRSPSTSTSRAGSASRAQTVALDVVHNVPADGAVQFTAQQPIRANSPPFASPPPSPLTQETVAFFDAEDSYASALDRLASVREERRLWRLLGDSPSADLPELSVLVSDMQKPPKRPRKLLDRFEKEAREVHWRDRVDYRAEWERYGARVPDEAFGKLKRRIKDVEKDDEDGSGLESDNVGSKDALTSRTLRSQTPAAGMLRSRDTSADLADSNSDRSSSERVDKEETMGLTEGGHEEDSDEEGSEEEDSEEEDSDEEEHMSSRADESSHDESDQDMPDHLPSPGIVIPSIEE